MTTSNPRHNPNPPKNWAPSTRASGAVDGPCESGRGLGIWSAARSTATGLTEERRPTPPLHLFLDPPPPLRTVLGWTLSGTRRLRTRARDTRCFSVPRVPSVLFCAPPPPPPVRWVFMCQGFGARRLLRLRCTTRRQARRYQGPGARAPPGRPDRDPRAGGCPPHPPPPQPSGAPSPPSGLLPLRRGPEWGWDASIHACSAGPSGPRPSTCRTNCRNLMANQFKGWCTSKFWEDKNNKPPMTVQ